MFGPDGNLYGTTPNEVFKLTLINKTPTVTGISPTSGPTAGTTVTITGTNFTGSTGLLFGAVAATNVMVAA